MIIYSLQANAIGRSAKTVREFLEKHYTDEVADSDDETIKLAIKALLEVSSFFSLVIFLVLSKGFMKKASWEWGGHEIEYENDKDQC